MIKHLCVIIFSILMVEHTFMIQKMIQHTKWRKIIEVAKPLVNKLGITHETTNNYTNKIDNITKFMRKSKIYKK